MPYKPDGAYSVDWANTEFLKFLSTLKSSRLTGSFARLRPTQSSDLDFRMNEADLGQLKSYLNSRGVVWQSDMIGHVIWGSGQNGPFDGIEVYTAFSRQKQADRAEFVAINGVRFRTW